ncbi:hypothetical protein [Coprobacillus cateniformis]|uniref:hypothetical protein n=3 Tax=Coprobacillus cateniformis TaxID=100884 RepID=UPI000E48A375|nr:hypothetical protein [Coprobacillus cateniformis]MVX26782.1 hypothetical protein [Coprobacillus cateniformis]RGY45282.1 hypothetical protein DXA41_13355 [Coprobacillus cateniformis]
MDYVTLLSYIFSFVGIILAYLYFLYQKHIFSKVIAYIIILISSILIVIFSMNLYKYYIDIQNNTDSNNSYECIVHVKEVNAILQTRIGKFNMSENLDKNLEYSYLINNYTNEKKSYRTINKGDIIFKDVLNTNYTLYLKYQDMDEYITNIDLKIDENYLIGNVYLDTNKLNNKFLQNIYFTRNNELLNNTKVSLISRGDGEIYSELTDSDGSLHLSFDFNDKLEFYFSVGDGEASIAKITSSDLKNNKDLIINF